MSKELMIPKNLTPEVFTTGGIEPLLNDIKSKVLNFNADISTEEGRKEVASFAYKIARSKTAVDDMGKEYVAKLKELPKQVDAQRKLFRESMDELRDKVRQPLTEWETAEKERIKGLELAIGEIINAGNVSFERWQEFPVDLMKDRLKKIQAEKETNWQEFSDRAEQVISEAIEKIETAISKKETYDNEQAELEQLRKEKAEREKRDYEEKIKQEAAEKARHEAEEKAAQEKAEIERKAREEVERIEREKKAAIESQERAEREAKEAVEKERARVAEKEVRKQEEEQKRITDKEHKKKIHSEIEIFLSSQLGLDDNSSSAVVDALQLGAIPHITIKY